MTEQELRKRNSRQGYTAVFNNPQVRFWTFQVILVGFLVWAFGSMWANLNQNRADAHIETGFKFLEQQAGFSISFSPFLNYSETSTYFMTYLVGLQNTLFISFIGVLLATFIGFIVGIARLSQNWVVNRLAYAYVETLRNIPVLLQIFIWYKGVGSLLPDKRNALDLGWLGDLNAAGLYAPNPVPGAGFGWVGIVFLFGIIASVVISGWAKKRQLATGQRFPVLWTSLGLIIALPLLVFFAMGAPLSFEMPVVSKFGLKGGLRITPEFLALLLALALYTGAFIAEIVRAGIVAVSKGQTEASQALGLSRGQGLRLVVIPQAMRVIIPPLTSQYLNLTKNSSLAVGIAYPDLTAVFAGTVLNQKGQAVEIMAMTMLTYLVISLLVAMFMNWFNARMALVER